MKRVQLMTFALLVGALMLAGCSGSLQGTSNTPHIAPVLSPAPAPMPTTPSGPATLTQAQKPIVVPAPNTGQCLQWKLVKQSVCSPKRSCTRVGGSCQNVAKCTTVPVKRVVNQRVCWQQPRLKFVDQRVCEPRIVRSVVNDCRIQPTAIVTTKQICKPVNKVKIVMKRECKPSGLSCGIQKVCNPVKTVQCGIRPVKTTRVVCKPGIGVVNVPTKVCRPVLVRTAVKVRVCGLNRKCTIKTVIKLKKQIRCSTVLKKRLVKKNICKPVSRVVLQKQCKSVVKNSCKLVKRCKPGGISCRVRPVKVVKSGVQCFNVPVKRIVPRKVCTPRTVVKRLTSCRTERRVVKRMVRRCETRPMVVHSTRTQCQPGISCRPGKKVCTTTKSCTTAVKKVCVAW